MTDLEIEVFLTIYKHKNFSKAAEQMFMSQSSISERLKALENKLGFVLFQRNKGGREITLTPEGRVFYELALQRQFSVPSGVSAFFTKISAKRIGVLPHERRSRP